MPKRIKWIVVTAIGHIVMIVLILLNWSGPPRHFSTVEELKSWIEKDQTNLIIVDGWECGQYALKLQSNALKEGFLLNLSVGIKEDVSHIFCIAIIGPKLYLIEPEDDKILDIGWIDPPAKN